MSAPLDLCMRMRTRTTPPFYARILWRRSVSAREVPHDLPQEFTAREKRSLGVRAHLHRLWRRLVKKSAPRLVLKGVSGFTEEEDDDDESERR